MEIVLITWVSGSGKSTLQEEFLKRGWKRPINFTTRKPRSDEELDEYVFISKDNFMNKLKNWDFLEHVEYNGNFYWISNCFLRDSFKIWYKEYEAAKLWDKIVIVVEPIWRAQIIQQLSNLNVKYKSYFLDISQDTQYKRLIKRWDWVEAAKIRANDFKYFTPTSKCIILSGEMSVKTLANIIEWWF